MPNVTMQTEKVMVVGMDDKRIVEKRFRAAGFDVVRAETHDAALALARHQLHNQAVILSQGSLVNVTETLLSLRDLCPSMKVIVVLERGTSKSNRFLRQLIGHPIEGSQIMTRRNLQRHLRTR